MATRYGGGAAATVTLTPGSPVAGHPSLQTNVSGAGTISFDIAHKKVNASWDPNVLGPITTIQFNADVVITSNVNFALNLFQGDSIYAPPNSRFQELVNFNVPQGLSQSHDISEFSKVAGSGGATPDFAPGAPPIMVGYNARRATTNQGNTNFRLGQYYAKLTGVPEPTIGTEKVLAVSLVAASCVR